MSSSRRRRASPGPAVWLQALHAIAIDRRLGFALPPKPPAHAALLSIGHAWFGIPAFIWAHTDAATSLGCWVEAEDISNQPSSRGNQRDIGLR